MFHPALSHLSAHTDRVSSAWLFLTVHFLENLFAENLFFNLFQTRMKVPCFGEYLLRLLLGAGASGGHCQPGIPFNFIVAGGLFWTLSRWRTFGLTIL